MQLWNSKKKALLLQQKMKYYCKMFATLCASTKKEQKSYKGMFFLQDAHKTAL